MHILPALFFVVALIYSSVGFAGGSSYLLVLTMAGMTHKESVPIALVCNMVVSSITFWHFFKAGHFRFRLVLPFMALSIPMAFFGAKLSISKEVFYLLLGASLALAALRIFFLRGDSAEKKESSLKKICLIGLPAGGIMGFFSGLIGIGGGIFLSPFLLLTGLATIKEASAAASFFIFINSLSGFLGKMPSSLEAGVSLPALVLSVICGGLIGSRLGSKYFPVFGLHRILAGVILFVSANLILKVF